ncbi:biotin/lipoyl-binding protein [Tabrizicola piscis]|uniref:Biotin/lipoyl-binding protein n=1 Tax=Tabrizicola piscis TaxID=2494374 RepID=A0A3S8U7E4_9RHOB|nr:efflux RND transporter periplasmic adaptor subunit [Tabrizicola piscis]AZL59524.1 biotin/lipoyl-binding protein [Tabrizicola piscis]
MTEIGATTPRKAGRNWLIGAALAIAVAMGVYFLGLPYLAGLQAEREAETQPDAIAPRRITALGEVLPVSNRVTVAAPTGQNVGRISRIDVAEGDTVAKGQVLAILDTEPLLRAELAQAVANESVKRVALAALTADLDATERQLAAQVDQLRVVLEKAQVELDRMTRLRDSGLYEDTALVDRRLDVQSATFNLRNIEIQLERNRLRDIEGLRIDQASAEAEIEAARAARAKAEADYAKSSVVAPIDGRILALFGRIGQQIDDSGFAEVGDTGQMKVRAEVYETDISGVTVGQGVTVTSRALGDELRGAVARLGVRISDQSILSTDPAAIVDARVIEVWITLDEAASTATRDLSGLQVLVAFDAREGDDA